MEVVEVVEVVDVVDVVVAAVAVVVELVKVVGGFFLKKEWDGRVRACRVHQEIVGIINAAT